MSLEHRTGTGTSLYCPPTMAPSVSLSRCDLPPVDVDVDDHLGDSEREAAARLLADAFLTSPMHVAVFEAADAEARRRQQAMFHVMLRYMGHAFYVARVGGHLAGVAGYRDSSSCQTSLLDQLRLAPSMAWALGRTLPRLMRWLGDWGERDPSRVHCHFGPLAVSPQFQGRGVGGRLLRSFCSYVDTTSAAAYLETDKPENVRLYRRFGFEVVEEARVFDVDNWFMWRRPR